MIFGIVLFIVFATPVVGILMIIREIHRQRANQRSIWEVRAKTEEELDKNLWRKKNDREMLC